MCAVFAHATYKDETALLKLFNLFSRVIIEFSKTFLVAFNSVILRFR